MNKDFFIAKQTRRALQMFLQSLTDESSMMEVADIYPKWNGESKSYKEKTILSYGVNKDGETQLYVVLQAHTSQPHWTPDTATSLYKKVGFTDSGVAIWTQPLCAEDAYVLGDIVMFNDKKYECTGVDGGGKNSWQPDVYGWTEIE